MRSLKIIIPAILFFLLIVGGIYTIYQAQVTPKVDLDITSLPTPPKNNFPESSATAKPQVNGASNVTNQPSTGSEDEIAVQNIGIRVNNIKQGQQITSPFTLTGIANVTSQTVNILVHDNAGNILGRGEATACISLAGCNFEASIAFQKPQGKTGYIEIYSPSTIDSSPTYPQIIPISF